MFVLIVSGTETCLRIVKRYHVYDKSTVLPLPDSHHYCVRICFICNDIHEIHVIVL